MARSDGPAAFQRPLLQISHTRCVNRETPPDRARCRGRKRRYLPGGRGKIFTTMRPGRAPARLVLATVDPGGGEPATFCRAMVMEQALGGMQNLGLAVAEGGQP